MNYDNHPGVVASECEARITVTAQPSSNHGDGYACGTTGGHCIPCDRCDDRRRHWNETQRLNGLFK